MMNAVLTKKEQRILAEKNRAALSAEDKLAFSLAASEKLSNLSGLKNAGYILSYKATENELCPDHLAELLLASDNKKTIAYPVSYSGGIMKAYKPNTEKDFVVGKYGIVSPDTARSELISPELFDVVLVPCVAFDKNLKRLGHGAGYYDRYLPLCKNAIFICIAFEAQKLDNISVDEHDLLMDMVVTESGIYLPE